MTFDWICEGELADFMFWVATLDREARAVLLGSLRNARDAKSKGWRTRYLKEFERYMATRGIPIFQPPSNRVD